MRTKKLLECNREDQSGIYDGVFYNDKIDMEHIAILEAIVSDLRFLKKEIDKIKFTQKQLVEEVFK